MKKAAIIILVFFVIIQAVPQHLPEVTKDNPDDLIKTANVPSEVADILRKACYDCHSNETVYPWYSHIAPVSFLVKRDTEEGREELNFSYWNKLKKSKKAKALDEIAEEVQEGEMPMGIYTNIHRDAKLTEKEKEVLINWTESYAESLFSN